MCVHIVQLTISYQFFFIETAAFALRNAEVFRIGHYSHVIHTMLCIEYRDRCVILCMRSFFDWGLESQSFDFFFVTTHTQIHSLIAAYCVHVLHGIQIYKKKSLYDLVTHIYILPLYVFLNFSQIRMIRNRLTHFQIFLVLI